MSENTTDASVRWLRIIGLILVIWAAITLISGLFLADVGVEGRTERFEDATIFGQEVDNYQTIAWVGGGIGVILLIVQYLLARSSRG